MKLNAKTCATFDLNNRNTMIKREMEIKITYVSKFGRLIIVSYRATVGLEKLVNETRVPIISGAGKKS